MRTITVLFVVLCMLQAACSDGPRPPSKFDLALAQGKEKCSNDGGATKEALSDVVSKVEHGTSVYVTRVWYNLLLDQKQTYAWAIASCYASGKSLLFYDAYTGKRVAYWGESGLDLEN